MNNAKLVDAIVKAFADQDALKAWVGLRVPGARVASIFSGGTLDRHVFEFWEWAQAHTREIEVLQLLADHPPVGGTQLASMIYLASDGVVRSRASMQMGIPPIAPVKDWFVTKRPFVNRKEFRDALETLDVAQDGSDSVLLIDGDRSSGKSFGIRFAKRVAPPGFIEVDPAEWGTVKMTAADVAAILTTTLDDPPKIDLTKEDEAVPRLFELVKQKLKGTGAWVIADHCQRGNLTRAAESLLLKLSSAIEGGSLPGVRMIMADVDREKLSPTLKKNSRYDRAALPSREHVRLWCESLSAHIGKPCTAVVLDEIVNDVFKGLADPPAIESLVEIIEDRLSEAFARISRC